MKPAKNAGSTFINDFPPSHLKSGFLLYKKRPFRRIGGISGGIEMATGEGTQTQGKFGEGLNKFKEEASHLGDRAKEELGKLKDRASVYKEGANEFLDAAAAYIRENPQRSVLIAAGTGIGLGIILGLLMRGRRD